MLPRIKMLPNKHLRENKRMSTPKKASFFNPSVERSCLFLLNAFFKEKKKKAKRRKRVTSFSCFTSMVKLVKNVCCFFSFLEKTSLYFQILFFVYYILSNFAHSLIVFGLITEFAHKQSEQKILVGKKWQNGNKKTKFWQNQKYSLEKKDKINKKTKWRETKNEVLTERKIPVGKKWQKCNKKT